MLQLALRKREGRFADRVRLNILIMAAQDKELDRIGKITEKTKTDMVIEAIQIWINSMRSAGV